MFATFRRALLITIATVVLMAPLVCIRFCQLMAEMPVAAPATASASASAASRADAMAGMSAMDMHTDTHGAHGAHGTHDPHAAHDTASNPHHAPLNHMRELVNAVTDYVTTLPAFAVLFVVVALVVIALAQRMCTSLDVPIPPPRFLAI